MSVECHTGKVHSKFQVPNMFAVHMNVPFVKFQYWDLKVLRILYFQVLSQSGIWRKILLNFGHSTCLEMRRLLFEYNFVQIMMSLDYVYVYL